jgi:Sel1 repeat
MIIKTWNKLTYETTHIDSKVKSGDEYFNIVKAWCLCLGYGWDKDLEKGQRILSENFDGEFSSEAKYLFVSIMRRENQNFRKELALLDDLDKSEFLPSTFRLGLYYEFGIDNLLKSDKIRAREYYLRASNLGHIQAKRRMISYRFENFKYFRRQLNLFFRIPLLFKMIIIGMSNPGDYRINY